MTGYAKEFGLNWPTLLACAIGMSLGSAVSHYTMNLLGPAMLLAGMAVAAQTATAGWRG